MSRSQPRNIDWTAAFVAAACAAVYWNSLPGTFVCDDATIVRDNPLLRDWQLLPALLKAPYWSDPGAQRVGGLYRPLTMLTYAVEWITLGAKPWHFHAFNLAAHAAVSLLVLSFWRRRIPREAAAWAALAFAVHPIHTEAVCGIVGRADILAAGLTLAAWRLAHLERRRSRLAAALACFGAGLLCKESGAAWPVALALGEAASSREALPELARRRAAVWAAALGVVGAYLTCKKLLLGAALTGGNLGYFNVTPLLVQSLTLARFYALHYAFPLLTGWGLRVEFARPSFPDSAANDLTSWLALAAVLTAAVWTCRAALRGKSPAGAAGGTFFLLMLPVSNLIVKMEAIGAERLLYLPSAALCGAFGLFASRLRARRAVALAALVWWGAAAWRRNSTWASNEAYWAQALRAAPDSPRALDGAGTVLASLGKTQEARALFERAAVLAPEWTAPRLHLAKAAFDEGRFGEARAGFQEIIHSRPRHYEALLHLGLIAERRRRWDEAERAYRAALGIDPRGALAMRNLGLLLCRVGRFVEGLPLVRAVLPYESAGADRTELSDFIRRIESGAAR